MFLFSVITVVVVIVVVVDDDDGVVAKTENTINYIFHIIYNKSVHHITYIFRMVFIDHHSFNGTRSSKLQNQIY